MDLIRIDNQLINQNAIVRIECKEEHTEIFLMDGKSVSFSKNAKVLREYFAHKAEEIPGLVKEPNRWDVLY